MDHAKKHSIKWSYKKSLFLAAAVLLLILCAAAALFFDELKIIRSIRKLDGEKPVWYMEVDRDYHFEEFLDSGGASSDQEVSAFLTSKISKGFYSVNVEETGPACSTISAFTPDGAHIWGRNFDWVDSVPIIVRHTPREGYASLSTCDFQNVTGNPEALPEGFANRLLAVAALYVPLDGVNEAGLCVADLEVNEGGMISVDTEKPDLTVTTAIRLLLNKAATVGEAVELLRQYDVHASGGISHHLAISDAAGASVSVEFSGGSPVVVDTSVVTNFNLSNGDTSAGGESARERYEYLLSVYGENAGVLTEGQVKDALSHVSQTEGQWTTQWSIVYGQASLTANYYLDCDYEAAHSLILGGFTD